MEKRKVAQLGDKILEKKAEDVTDFGDKKIQELIDDMMLICRKKAEHSAGLAAPQLSVLKKIIIVRRVDLEEELIKQDKKVNPKTDDLWEIMVNPEIIEKSKKTSVFWEGCLSVQNGEVFGPVRRASFIKIRYKDRFGAAKKLEVRDFQAHVILHEVDHLYGILFVKYIKDPDNLWSDKELDKYIEENGDLPPVEV